MEKIFAAFLTDLSEAFDCLDHELLTATLNVCTLNLPALRLIRDYLPNIKQRTKIESTYSTWMETVFGVTQGSILGPLLYNIFLADLFFIMSNIDIASYADDNTSNIVSDNIDDLIKSIGQA